MYNSFRVYYSKFPKPSKYQICTSPACDFVPTQYTFKSCNSAYEILGAFAFPWIQTISSNSGRKCIGKTAHPPFLIPNLIWRNSLDVPWRRSVCWSVADIRGYHGGRAKVWCCFSATRIGCGLVWFIADYNVSSRIMISPIVSVTVTRLPTFGRMSKCNVNGEQWT